MGKSEQETIRNATIAEVLGGLIVVAVVGLVAPVREWLLQGVHWCWQVVLEIWEHLTASVSVPWWSVYLCGLILCIILWRGCRATIRSLAREAVDDSFLSYREDIFFNMRWRWRWTQDGVTDIACYCPQCDLQLIPQDLHGETGFSCERCGQDVYKVDGNMYQFELRIAREVQRKARTGEWKNAVEKKGDVN